jgi:hypothetical protein
MSRPVELLARGFGEAACDRRAPWISGGSASMYAPHEIPADLATNPVVKPGHRPIIGA